MIIKGEEIPVYKIPFRVANHIIRKLYGFYLDRKVVDYLAKWQHVNHDEERIIRVGFLVQDPTCWDKVEPIYDSLNNNPRFDVKLVVVPDYDLSFEVATKVGQNRNKSNFGNARDIRNELDKIIDNHAYNLAQKKISDEDRYRLTLRDL